MLSLSITERKAKFNTDDLSFRKEFNLPSWTLLFLSSYVDIEYTSAESLTNKYNLFGTKSKQTVNFLNISKISLSLTPSMKEIYNDQKT